MSTEHEIWTPDHIISALWAKGFSLRRLAEDLETTPNTLRRNIRTGRSAKIRAAISARIQVPEWRLWPDVFPPQWRESGPPTA